MSYDYSTDPFLYSPLYDDSNEFFPELGNIQSTSPEEEYFPSVFHNKFYPAGSCHTHPTTPRYIDTRVLPIAQSNRYHHTSGDPRRHSISMNINCQLPPYSRHDPLWSPSASLNSPQEYWPHSSGLTRTPSDSTGSTDSTLPTYGQIQSKRHDSNCNNGPSSGSSTRQSTGGESNSKSGGRVECTIPNCTDASGKQRSFSRKADLSRHYNSIHQITWIDCPFALHQRPRCDRKGENGFARRDHLNEHLRGLHGMRIEKRGGRSGDGDEENTKGGRHRRSS